MNTASGPSFASPGGAILGGARDAFGVPVIVLGASYVGFGSLVRESGFGLGFGLFSTFSAWALPGQVALVELYSVGSSLFIITIAVLLTNARLMPMVMTLAPMFRDPATPRWKVYMAAHCIAVTAWVAAMKRCPTLPVEQRLPYFAGFAVLLWATSMGGTAAGFFLAGQVPEPVSLGLVFLNPIYFMLVLATGPQQRTKLAAVILGLVLGPALHLVTPDWGLLITGVVAGTAGYGLGRLMEKRRG